AWCNRQLLHACRPLSAEQLHAPFEIGQGSVWRSLVHLLAADSLWLDAFEGRPDSPAPCEADFKDLQELADRWADLDRRWLDALARLDGSDLERPSSGRTCGTSASPWTGWTPTSKSVPTRRTQRPSSSTCSAALALPRSRTACWWPWLTRRAG